MRAAFRLPLASLAVAILIVWVISVAGATGWGFTVNWTLFSIALVLLALRRVT